MDTVLDIQATNFKDETNSEKPVVVEFWIKSCGNCKKFKPVYEQLASIFGDKLKFTRINMFESIENLRLAEKLGVTETPTVKIFYKSAEIGQIIGSKKLEVATEDLQKIITESRCCKELNR